MSISQDERERAIFRSRKKFQMDHASDMATAEDRGRQEEKIKRIKSLLDVLDIEIINVSLSCKIYKKNKMCAACTPIEFF